MKKIILSTFLFISLVASPSWAGLGDDDTKPFSDEQPSEGLFPQVDDAGNPNEIDFETDDKFGRESFSKGEPEQIMGPPPPRVPLDGGASLLLIGGIGLGIRKLFGKKK